VIVRLMGEGQYRVGDDVLAQLNRLDDEASAAIDANDEERLDQTLEQMFQLVRAEGERLADDDLSPSDVVIPPSDMTLEETRALFSEEGLIPDLPAQPAS
jgi:PspA-Associated protein